MKKNKLEKIILIALQGFGMSFLGGSWVYYTVEDEPSVIVCIIALSIVLTSWIIRKIIEVE